MLSSVSAFFPCYNDAGTIQGLVLRIEEALKTITDDFEIIVVNDGSSDDSAEILRATMTSVPALRVIEHPVNRGYGAALITGFGAASRDYVFYTDGDGQYDPAEVVLLAEAMGPDIDVVNGYKRSREDAWYRKLVGGIYQKLARVAFDLPIRDVDCDFRLLRRVALQDIALESSDGAICVELVRRLRDSGARMAEVQVSHFARAYGSSQFFKPKRILRAVQGVGRWYIRLVILREQQRKHLQAEKARMALANLDPD